MNPLRLHSLLVGATFVVLFPSAAAFAEYIKPLQTPSATEQPPDVDKTQAGEFIDCWLITGANMLAAAGYGDQTKSAQDRATDIYHQLQGEFPPTGG